MSESVVTYDAHEYGEYVRHIERYLVLYGVTGWEVHYIHSQLEPGVAASISYNTDARTCIFKLTQSLYREYPCEYRVKALAEHEVLHLLLAPMLHEYSEGEEHSVIERLMSYGGTLDEQEQGG